MDDQNNNPGSGTPSEPTAAPSTPVQPEAAVPDQAAQSEPAVEPAAPAAQPQEEQKCVTCGNAASGGTCSACGQGEITCTCTPTTNGPTAPVV